MVHIAEANKKEIKFMNIWGKRIIFSNPILTKVLFEVIDGYNYKDYNNYDIAYHANKNVIKEGTPMVIVHDKPIYVSLEDLAMYGIIVSVERGIITEHNLYKIMYGEYTGLFKEYDFLYHIEPRTFKTFEGYMESLILNFSYYLYGAIKKYLWAKICKDKKDIQDMKIFQYTYENKLKKLDLPISYFIYNPNVNLEYPYTICSKFYTIKDYEKEYVEENPWIYTDEDNINILYRFMNLEDLDLAICFENTEILKDGAKNINLPENKSFNDIINKIGSITHIDGMNKYQFYIRQYLFYIKKKVCGELD